MYPYFVACDCNLTVEHFLLECGDFGEFRQRYYYAKYLLQQLFQKISVTYAMSVLGISKWGPGTLWDAIMQ